MLKLNNRKRVEDILQEYPLLIAQEEMLIITTPDRPDVQGMQYSDMPRSGEVKSREADQVIECVDHERELNLVTKKIVLVRAALKSLPDQERRIIELKYFSKWTDEKISEDEVTFEEPRHPKTVAIKRRRILDKLAELGLVKNYEKLTGMEVEG